MAEYIDRIAFRKHIDDFYPFDKEGQKDTKYDFAKGTFLRLLACFAQADVVERKTGCWRHYEGELTCSECSVTIYDDIMSLLGDDVPRFCPNCGAQMEGDGKDV